MVAQYVSGLPYSNIKVAYVNHNLIYLLVMLVTCCLFIRSKNLRLIFIGTAIITVIYIPFSVEKIDLIFNKKVEIALFTNENDEIEFSNKKIPSWYKSAYLGYSGEVELKYNPDTRSSEFCCYEEYCAYTKDVSRVSIKVDNLFKQSKSLNGCSNFGDKYKNNYFLNLDEIGQGFYISFTKDKIQITKFEDIIGNRPWATK